MELTAPALRFAGPVTLIGGGPVAPGDIARALAVAPGLIGVDGGGDTPASPGREFDAVIGDMDSLTDPEFLRARGVPLHRVAEQDSTDLEKCLYSVEAPLFVGLGFIGGRADHQLAAMNALAKNAGKTVLLLGARDICFRCPPGLDLVLEAGCRVSLFPMGRAVGTRCEGLRWSTVGLDFAPAGRIGTSNIALGGPVRVAFDGDPVLVILPAAQFEAVAACLPVGR